MENGYRITTTPYADGKIIQECGFVNNGVVEQLTKQIIDTQEQQIREALMQLGWTPPK